MDKDSQITENYVINEEWTLNSLGFDEPAVMDPKRIPLPTELPNVLDTEHLPPEVLRSHTLEMLLRQNQDLVARLQVNIRRCAVMEEQVFQLEDTVTSLRRENDVLSDQNELLREQDKIIRGRNDFLEKNVGEFQSEATQSQRRFAELKSSLEDTVEHLQARNLYLDKQNLRFKKYKHLIRDRVRGYVRHLKSEVAELRDLLNEKVAAYRELQARLSDTLHYLQKMSKEFEDNQRNLSRRYEDQIEHMGKQIAELLDERRTNEEKLMNLNRILDKNVALENELISLRRQTEAQDV